MLQKIPNVNIAHIEAVITCPRCGNPGEFQSPDDQMGVHAGSKFMCVACENVFEIYIKRPTRAAELPLEPTTQHSEAGDAPTLSGLYNCQLCGLEKCSQPGICQDCLSEPSKAETDQWSAANPASS